MDDPLAWITVDHEGAAAPTVFVQKIKNKLFSDMTIVIVVQKVKTCRDSIWLVANGVAKKQLKSAH